MDDLDAVLDYQSRPDVVRFVPWPVRNASLVEEALTKAIGQTTLNQQGEYLSLAVIRKDQGRLVGQVNAVYLSEKNQCGEIGYVVNPRFSRRGFGVEATRALVSALFDTNRFHRIVARFDDRNVASRAVLERLGFREEAHCLEDDFFKGEWINTVIFATLRDEWGERESLSR
jgi:RimJ/RimL family protein N-acetyltransferase